MKNTLIISIALTTFFSCKNSKQTAQANPTPAVAIMTAPASDAEKELPDSVYRVIVSFISIGEGTDAKAKEQLDELVNNHQRDFGMPLASEEFRWGREGEVDYCFKMKDDNSKAKDSFVRELRAKFAGNKLVQIEENAVCRHKR